MVIGDSVLNQAGSTSFAKKRLSIGILMLIGSGLFVPMATRNPAAHRSDMPFSPNTVAQAPNQISDYALPKPATPVRDLVPPAILFCDTWFSPASQLHAGNCHAHAVVTPFAPSHQILRI
jgi:hypothetical protein